MQTCVYSNHVLAVLPTVLSVFPAVIGGFRMHWLVATPACVAHHYFATADELPPELQDHVLGPAAMLGKIRASSCGMYAAYQH